MAKTMTPSQSGPKTTLPGQIDKSVGQYRAMLEKHASEFDSEVVQVVLGEPGLAREMFALFRKRVEARASEIVRRVKVNRSRDPQAMLDDLGRNQYTDKDVVATMPRGEGEEVDVVFFKPDLSDKGGYISDADLVKEFESRGLTPDPYAQAQVNKEDPAFADERPNGTHWKKGDSYHFAAFRRWHGERRVDVDRCEDDWDGPWWFAGVRK